MAPIGGKSAHCVREEGCHFHQLQSNMCGPANSGQPIGLQGDSFQAKTQE
jgi:hypothetical protein